MKWILASLALISLAASATEPSIPIHIAGNYGSLGYVAIVNVTVDRENVVFKIDKLTLTFDPDAVINSTTKIASPSVRIVASKVGVGGNKATILYEALVRTNILS